MHLGEPISICPTSNVDVCTVGYSWLRVVISSSDSGHRCCSSSSLHCFYHLSTVRKLLPLCHLILPVFHLAIRLESMLLVKTLKMLLKSLKCDLLLSIMTVGLFVFSWCVLCAVCAVCCTRGAVSMLEVLTAWGTCSACCSLDIRCTCSHSLYPVHRCVAHRSICLTLILVQSTVAF